MKQDRLKSCMLVHCHKTLVDTIDPVVIAKVFATANDKGRVEGGSSERRIICLKQEKGKSGRSDWDISFLFLSAHDPPPPPPSYGRLFYVVFVVGTIEDYIQGIQMSVVS